MMAAQVMAMAHRKSLCGMYANPKPVSAGGGVLLNKPATTGLLRFGKMRSKREIGCVGRGEKEEVGLNKVEPYAECIVTRTSELKAGSLWKIFSLTDDGDSKEERKDKKSSCQVKELVQVHKAGIYLSVLSFALCFALKQAGVDVSTMLRKVHEKREKYWTFLSGYAAQDVASRIEILPTLTLTPILTGAVSHGAPRMGCGMRDYRTSEFRHGASRMAWTSQVSLKKASPSRHLVSKPVASLSCTAALGTTCQAEQQTMQNKSAVVSKAPIESKDKAFTPKLDDGGIGGGPGGGGDGGGGGGGGGVVGGGFLFWGLLMLIGFLRDNESEKPYRQKVNKKKGSRVKRQPQMQVD